MRGVSRVESSVMGVTRIDSVDVDAAQRLEMILALLRMCFAAFDALEPAESP